MKIIKSTLDFSHVYEKIINFLQENNIKIFNIIDHSAEAEKVGLKMQNTRVIIFGSPKIGTILMQNFPKVAIDLPLKIMLYQNLDNKNNIQTIICFKSIKTILDGYNYNNISNTVDIITNLENNILDILS